MVVVDSHYQSPVALLQDAPPLSPKLITLQNRFSPSTLVRIEAEVFAAQHIELWLKRDDLLHPIISGNKWRKLKYILNHALSLNAKTLVSMGGAYSNHLHALAFAGRQLGLKTAAFIRGEHPQVLSPTLEDLLCFDMRLQFVSREAYRQLRAYREHDALPDIEPCEYWLPEGGATRLALQGVAELLDEIDLAYDVLCVPCGTATTLAGLIVGANPEVKLLGIAALKGADFLNTEVSQLLATGAFPHWQINGDYHCGGFAKTTPELLRFISDFERRYAIALEPVYTGKMLFALFDLARQGYFQPGQRIIAIHTGGLQGNRHLPTH